MKVKDLEAVKREPVTIKHDRMMEEAMRRLLDNKVSALIVVDDERVPVGIITERDIFHLAYRYRGDMMDIKIGDHMTTGLTVCHMDDDIEDVARKMLELRFRHMPITDDSNHLIAMLSIRDIVRAKLD